MISTLLSLTIALTLFFTSCSSPTEREGNSAHLRVAVSSDPKGFDPRLIRDTVSANVAHMLFDGLFRSGPNGMVLPGIAESYTVSNDGTRYTFNLKESSWSDGTPLTAHDFEYTWKSMLAPDFPAPNAFQLFVIKGARSAKIGNEQLDNVAIAALDAHTLQVDLERPTPYFLELLTTHFYSPVNARWALKKEREASPETMPVNGPFKLKKWSRNNEVLFTKNENYWDAATVSLSGISLLVLDESTALQMFDRQELDWIGSPMGYIPPDAIAGLKGEQRLKISPAAGVHWFRLNTEKAPLDNAKLRLALAYAINRKELVESILQTGQQPALGIVPAVLSSNYRPRFKDHDLTEAWDYYQQALEEMGHTKDDLPQITLCYSANERNHKIAQAIQQQWKKGLGLTVALESCEGTVFFDRLGQHTYQIALGSWFADIRDPINFLEIYKYKWTNTNNTQWESPLYTALLEEAENSTPAVRAQKLDEAESLLMKEMPVIPIYFATFNHLQQPGISGVYFSELGFVDFKTARIVGK